MAGERRAGAAAGGEVRERNAHLLPLGLGHIFLSENSEGEWGSETTMTTTSAVVAGVSHKNVPVEHGVDV